MKSRLYCTDATPASDYPRLAIETDDPSVRVMPVLPYRYLIFYQFADNRSLFATFASRRDSDL